MSFGFQELRSLFPCWAQFTGIVTECRVGEMPFLLNFLVQVAVFQYGVKQTTLSWVALNA